QNYPLYFKTIHEDDDLNFFYTVHTSLDVIEERMTVNVHKNTNEMREPYLGLLYPTEDYRVYGYVTNTKTKFLILVDSGNNNLRDNEIKMMFRQLHNAYVELMSNPFYTPGESITSK
ncbi:hypothetical protein HELRODRAFT_126817, partial [Helobdella robusta]|uniref:Trafficking protein particle complex subunit 2-like protein n=1 Tax=Helobdella robusta TaxID=6412 RepID=T1EHB1_HELRO